MLAAVTGIITLIPTFVSAETVTANTTILANINLTEAKVISQTKDTLRIGFTLTNLGATAQTDIRYSFQLIKVTAQGQSLSDTFDADETLSLAAGQSIQKQSDYPAPRYLSGTYDVYVVARTTGGLMLGVGKAGKVTLTGDPSYVELVPESCALKVKGDRAAYTLYQGVDVGQSEILSLSCEVQNHGASARTLVPSFETNRRTTLGEVVKTETIDPQDIALAAGEKKTVDIVVPKALEPQAYDVAVALADKATGSLTSNKITAHYVLQGASATIQNVFLDHSSYAKGDPIVAKIDWSPSADSFLGSRAGKGSALGGITGVLSVVDQNGNPCAEPASTTLSPDSRSATITATATTKCVQPTATVTLLDANKKTLDTRTVTSPVEITPFWNTTTISVAVAALIVLVGLGFLVLRARRGNSMPAGSFKALALIAVLSSGFFLGVEQAKAASWTDFPSLVYEADIPIQYSFYTNYTANTDKNTYYPGESVGLTGSAYFASCGNSTSGASMTASLEGQTITLLAPSLIRGGTVLYGEGTLTAPMTPGQYTIVVNSYSDYTRPAGSPLTIVGTAYLPITVVRPPPPTAWIAANPNPVDSGANTTVTWGSTNATSCTAYQNDAHLGSVSVSGSYTYAVVQVDTWRIVCTGLGGNYSAATTVNLNALSKAPQASLTIMVSKQKPGINLFFTSP